FSSRDHSGFCGCASLAWLYFWVRRLIMKPFNLEKALAGEPVKLRNGKKAYVRHHEREHYTCRPLVGYLENAFGGVWLISWTRSGRADIESNDALNDIIGMWPRT